ncbi:hypothetical protein [Algoriphagus confluentis]|uniref:Uncharacterized protein n=1 Tax=Algoriphagus confluentis TaxID=1697556 RepID=A0ABQ6PLW9_9BACT|nr:hypothetical protein Aconfl_16100 [Algoriphagus confluentis]
MRIDETTLQVLFERSDHYLKLMLFFGIAGWIGFLFLKKEDKTNPTMVYSLGILLHIAFYEFLASILAAQQINNHWVYNIFNGHIGSILFLLLIRNLLKKKTHRRIVLYFIAALLLISGALHFNGIASLHDGGEYIALVNTVFILSSCSLYFFELITMDENLAINPLKSFSFWVTTIVLFYFSSSFMIYISYVYLYTHHLDIFYMVYEIPRHMSLLCNLLLCLGIYSKVMEKNFELEIIHV